MEKRNAIFYFFLGNCFSFWELKHVLGFHIWQQVLTYCFSLLLTFIGVQYPNLFCVLFNQEYYPLGDSLYLLSCLQSLAAVSHLLSEAAINLNAHSTVSGNWTCNGDLPSPYSGPYITWFSYFSILLIFTGKGGGTEINNQSSLRSSQMFCRCKLKKHW